MKPWNYNTNRNNISEIPFIKVYWIRYTFEAERYSLYTKSTNISRHQITNFLKLWFLLLVSTKRQNRNKIEFVTKLEGIIRLFSYKNISKVPCKMLFTQSFFINHLKHKIVNKKAFKMPSANPRHQCAH